MVLKYLEIVIIYLAFSLADNIKIRPLLKPTGKDPPNSDKPEDRIINGFTPGRFDNPWVVLLVVQFSQSTLSCSGSIISSQWVVTAGHCGKGAVSIQVQLGLYSRNEGPSQIIIVPANSIFVHPNYFNMLTAINDIALLRLNPRANTAFSTIQPITYPCPTGDSYAGRIGRACGWGITRDGNADITTVIQCVDMPVISNIECKQTWGVQVRLTNVCTRSVNSRTTCHGDSGGPLVVVDGASRRLKLIGATSFGSDPCAQTAPDVFTRITSYNDWIRFTSGVFCDSS